MNKKYPDILDVEAIRENGLNAVDALLKDGSTISFFADRVSLTDSPFVTLCDDIIEDLDKQYGDENEDMSMVSFITSHVYARPSTLRYALFSLPQHCSDWYTFAGEDDGNCCVTIHPIGIKPFTIALIKGKYNDTDCYYARRISNWMVV